MDTDKLSRAAPVYHLGLFREKVTLQPVECKFTILCTLITRSHVASDYSKLPPSPPVDQVFLLDPLIATGGTACAALAMIADWGIARKVFSGATDPNLLTCYFF